MQAEAVATRYANALFQSITDPAERERTVRLLAVLSAELQSPSGPKSLILNPFYSATQREAALLKLIELNGAETPCPQMTRRFLQLLLRKNRLQALQAVTAAFGRLLDESRGRLSLTVSTAKPLDQAAQQALHARLEQLMQRPVGITHQVDPSLLGGARLQLGSRLIDGTIRGTLDRIRRKTIGIGA
ncbi:MAG TPA: ATP synthase F1 subunit delta [Nitrospiria bacterium]|nr:ATP synthase F1 subunit delta [Nitrospiria bacterium]